MTRLDFNLAIAREVMGWEIRLRLNTTWTAWTGYQWWRESSEIRTVGPDFTRDHNAAAMVRERVGALGLEKQMSFVSFMRPQVNWNLTHRDVFRMLSATPEQTARAAYLAVTGKELEVVDE